MAHISVDAIIQGLGSPELEQALHTKASPGEASQGRCYALLKSTGDHCGSGQVARAPSSKRFWLCSFLFPRSTPVQLPWQRAWKCEAQRFLGGVGVSGYLPMGGRTSALFYIQDHSGRVARTVIFNWKSEVARTVGTNVSAALHWYVTSWRCIWWLYGLCEVYVMFCDVSNARAHTHV